MMTGYIFLLCLSLLLSVTLAEDPWQVEFTVNLGKGDVDTFVMTVHPDWAPLGAARFKTLVEEDFFNHVRFFRVISGFMAQFGIHGNPQISSHWKTQTLQVNIKSSSSSHYYMSLVNV